jgi:hypothetical protein
MIASRTGSPDPAEATSAARTAYPSMAARGNGQRSAGAMDIAGEHAAVCLHQRHRLVRQARCALQDPPQGLLD